MNNAKEMFAEERKQKIVEIVNRKGNVTVQELCEYFGMSPATVRNDLHEMEELNLLRRTHGGAISNRRVSFELFPEQKEVVNSNAKKKIAEYAARYVHDGDSVLIDTGTTMMEFAKQLCRFRNLTVITNDLRIALFLDKYSDALVIMLGGSIRKKYSYTLGDITKEIMSMFNVDTAFMGSNGISFEKGVTTSHADSVGSRKALIKSAMKVILLADSSKIGTATFATYADISDFDVIITDEPADENFIAGAAEIGVNVYAVK